MSWLFLEELGLDVAEIFGGSDVAGNIIPLLISAILIISVVLFIIWIGIYVYSSLAYVAIGKKAKHKSPGIAWIPFVGKPLLTSQISEKPWWPILFLIGCFFTAIPLLGGAISSAFLITFSVFFLIWNWKTYEKVGHPGWFALLFLVPIVGYVFLGIVAWSKESVIEPIKPIKKK